MKAPNGAHRTQIFDRLNAIRERAGLSTVQDSWGRYGINPNKFNEQVGLRDIIRRERTIELCSRDIVFGMYVVGVRQLTKVGTINLKLGLLLSDMARVL